MHGANFPGGEIRGKVFAFGGSRHDDDHDED
jgi:hypothetical protein